MQNFKRGALILLLLSLVIAFFAFDLKQYLSFAYLKGQRDMLVGLYDAKPVVTGGIYFLIYVVVTALSLPGAAIMTLAGGAIFGLPLGTLLVSFASTIGATSAFFASRYLLRDTIQSKFAEKLKEINRGIEREGAMYLFTLRLIPAVPFFVINLVMGLTPMRALTFFLVSQIGMLPGTIVFVNAGTQLGQLESVSGILSPKLIISFVILGLFPIAAKKIMNRVRGRKLSTKSEQSQEDAESDS